MSAMDHPHGARGGDRAPGDDESAEHTIGEGFRGYLDRARARDAC